MSVAVAITFLLPTFAAAKTLTVPGEYPTISNAISAANNGDHVSCIKNGKQKEWSAPGGAFPCSLKNGNKRLAN